MEYLVSDPILLAIQSPDLEMWTNAYHFAGTTQAVRLITIPSTKAGCVRVWLEAGVGARERIFRNTCI
jgi:hypothetical protein